MEHSPELHYLWSMVVNIQRQEERGLMGLAQEKGFEQGKRMTLFPLYGSWRTKNTDTEQKEKRNRLCIKCGKHCLDQIVYEILQFSKVPSMSGWTFGQRVEKDACIYNILFNIMVTNVSEYGSFKLYIGVQRLQEIR